MHRIPDTKMDEEIEEMSQHSAWSGSGTVQSGPAAYPGSGYRGRRQFGFSSGQSVSSEGDMSLKRDREREGRCGECGVQTHDFLVNPTTGAQRKVAMSVDGEVHRGRCLLCHPFHPNARPFNGAAHQTVDTNSVHSGGHNNYNQFRSTRSINTVSSHGGSVHSQSGASGFLPDAVESSVVSNTPADEALALFDNESCDLLDILTAMRRFPNEQRIQERGCEKLWIQSWDDENSSAIGRVGGISILLNAMSNFPASQRLQQSGCEALQNLAVNEYNRDAIVEHGGIRVIINAMNNHGDVVGVQQCGCTALANLATSPDNHMDIVNAGGLHAIMDSAQRNQDEESVLRAAYQALRALGYDPNRHGPSAPQHQHQQQQSPQQQQQQQQQQAQQQMRTPPPQQQTTNAQRMGVIRLDAHGFPIN